MMRRLVVWTVLGFCIGFVAGTVQAGAPVSPWSWVGLTMAASQLLFAEGRRP